MLLALWHRGAVRTFGRYTDEALREQLNLDDAALLALRQQNFI